MLRHVKTWLVCVAVGSSGQTLGEKHAGTGLLLSKVAQLRTVLVIFPSGNENRYNTTSDTTTLHVGSELSRRLWVPTQVRVDRW